MSRAIFKSTGVVGLTTLLSRITGLLRDVALAQAFGAGAFQDAFLVAYKIPNFLRRLFAETDHFMFAESNTRVRTVIYDWLDKYFPVQARAAAA